MSFILPGMIGVSGKATLTNTYSLSMTGANEYVDFGSGTGLIGTNSVSIVAWVKISDNNDIQTILSTRSTSKGWSFDINTGLSGFTNITFWNAAAADGIRCDFATYDQWVNIVLVRDGTANNKIYVNGVSQTLTLNDENNSDPGSINSLKMGCSYISGSPNRVINGKVDEVAIIQSALSQSNVTAIYNSGEPIDLTTYSPINWWRNGDIVGGTGSTITDQGSLGDDGTLTNSPTFSTDIPS